jgi:hypothetical protein
MPGLGAGGRGEFFGDVIDGDLGFDAYFFEESDCGGCFRFCLHLVERLTTLPGRFDSVSDRMSYILFQFGVYQSIGKILVHEGMETLFKIMLLVWRHYSFRYSDYGHNT